MILVYFFISFIQPILLFTPEMVTIAGGSLTLGPFRGFIIGFIGILSGIITMYFIGRYARQPILNKLGNENLFDKYNRLIERYGVSISGALFILPVLPDNIICLGAGISKVPLKKFILIATFSKLITTFVYAYSLELANIFPITKLQLAIGKLLIITIICIATNLIKKSRIELV